MSNISLGDRMKMYERAIDYSLNPNMQYMIRLDGNSFSRRTKQWKLEKPFDVRFNNAMVAAAKSLFDLIPNIVCIWTGSDEISVWFNNPDIENAYFNNRIQKIISLASSQVSVNFTLELNKQIPGNNIPGIFDARMMEFPNELEAINCFMFRQRDCIKNSISGYAQQYFSNKQLLNKNSAEKITMLEEHNLRWNEQPNWAKHGVFLYKELYTINSDINGEYKRHYINVNDAIVLNNPSDINGIFNSEHTITEAEWLNLK
jgi:tRNA(His) 5'-end guanylyltransferase